MATEKGFLIIADISGYTDFTLHSELEHAEGIMTGLITTILEAMKTPFKVSKLEGDAVFSYIPSNSFCQKQSLLEALEKIYFDFSDTLFQMRKNTNCPCKACSNIKNLDLKILMHYGEYVVSDIAGRAELSGTDVILIHRLLKNSIVKKTGIEAYCFFTEQSASAMSEGSKIPDLCAHQEKLDQFGSVEGYVYSLRKAWEDYKEHRRIRVDPKDAFLSVSQVIPLSQAATWDFMHDDKHWIEWSLTEKSDIQKPENGKNGIGLKKHCVHGKDNIAHTIIDWRPFDYYTTDLVINGVVKCRQSVVLDSGASGTKVTFYSECPHTDKLVPKLILIFFKSQIKNQIQTNIQKCLTKLRHMIEDERLSNTPDDP